MLGERSLGSGTARPFCSRRTCPLAQEGKSYEAWLMRGGVPKPAGTFEPHDGVAAMPIEGFLHGVDAVAVTIEPSSGAPTPRDEPLLTATVWLLSCRLSPASYTTT